MSLTDRATGAAYTAGWALVRRLPQPVAAALFRRGADAATRRRGSGVRRLQRNLERVTGGPVPAELLRAAVRSYARYWLEVFRLPVTPIADVVASVSTDGEPAVRAAYAQGRGVVLALPHSANWDLAGAWATATGLPFTTVAERLKPASLFDAFVEFRESLGMEVLPLTGGERPPADVLEERLRAGGVLCLLADRDLARSGVEVELFGATTRIPAGPALLAVRTGAALVPVSLSYRGPGLHIRFHPEVVPPAEGSERERVAAAAQGLATALEAGIRAAPQDWHMLQRLWLDDLAADDPRRVRAAAP